VNFVAVSYSVTLAVFAALLLLVAFSWRGKSLGLRVMVACATMVVWAAIMMRNSFVSQPSFLAVYLPEFVRNAVLLWLVFSVAGNSIPRWFRIAYYVAACSMLAIALGSGLGLSSNGDLLLARSGLVFSFAGLASLEQTIRNARSEARTTLRYLILGLGILFAYDLFLYSQVELLDRIRMDAWAARGIIDAFAAPLIAVAISRNPTWSIRIFVSRQVVFYSTTFLAVGIYLLFVSFGGYYVRIVGGTWGGLGQILFFAGSLLVLASVLFSQPMRRRAMVFISKHFYQNKYDYRIEWLRFVQTLSTNTTLDIRSNAVHAIAQTMGSPGGVLYMPDESGKRFVPVASWPDLGASEGAQEIDGDEEIIRILEQRQWIVDLQEFRLTPDVYQNISLPACLARHATARIVSPVLELNRLAGFVVLNESAPPFNLMYEDRDLLKTLGSHVATYLAQHEASGKLAENRQFEAYNKLTTFMMHDLKNSVAQMKLIVSNAARHKHNPEFIDDTIATIANAADRMTRLIEQLKSESLTTSIRRVDINDLATAVAARCADRKPVPTVVVAARPAFVVADSERLTSVIEHVIRNAQDATPDHGRVDVTIECEGGRVRLLVSDTGDGMDAHFLRDRLFKPFDSTKGSKGMGIGAYQVREYVRSLGGDVEVRSSPGSGTSFGLVFSGLTDGIASVG
jgi:putative PEP-CTERM system histidine kinase